MPDLYQHSIEVIMAHQAASGGYLASPTFADYRYCWFRDGAYTAYAMDLAGCHESAHRFHDWCARVVNRRQAAVERAIAKAKRGEALSESDYLHTRYTLDGHESDDETWPNFQLDGLGTWLWALVQHAQLAGLEALPLTWREATLLTARYLAALWQHPCFDCWEEFGDRVHPYTLATIYGGLRALTSLGLEGEWRSVPPLIRAHVLERGVHNGWLVKSIGNPAVDASLIGVATPYRLLAIDDPLMQATVTRIETELRREGGGVHRYATDTYYGGGEWVLLTAWLGWYYAEMGEIEKAREMLAWVEAQADAQGNLPEQVPRTLTAPRYLEIWRQQRGEIANPLLWSHAKYIILWHFLHLPGS
ncbi:MAG: glycoside hydrolase family 15 protein [Anaerolineae bacterium]|nr:glycoside hydrolase family 15 protein [Anaerolineae bacterium]